jgi:hypothetical protein
MPAVAKGKTSGARTLRAKTVKITEGTDADPTRFTYALAAWSTERRGDGWYVSATTATLTGDKPHWRGPFATIETACLAIARHLAVEIADRHSRSIEFHKLDARHPLYGLKPTTRLNTRDDGSVT